MELTHVSNRVTIVDDMAAAVEATLVSAASMQSDRARQVARACVLSICDRIGGAQEYIPRFPVIDGERVVAYPDALHRQPDWRTAQTVRIIATLRSQGYTVGQIVRTTGLSRRQVCKHLARIGRVGVPPVQVDLPF